MEATKREYDWTYPPFFEFERNFDDVYWIDWIDRHWFYTIPIGIVYVLSLWPLQKWMEGRPPMKSRAPLIVWNFFLCVFSVTAAVRGVPVLLLGLYRDGFLSTVCDNKYYSREFGNIWGILFVLSKIPELGDTYFIILRKQKLIFLHWYHHFSVMIFCTHLYGHRCSAAFWFSVMNYAVHAVMYTYYFVRAMGFRLPKPISMSVTTLQISQMFMGNFIVYYVLYQKYVGTPCQSLDLDLYYGTFIYGSYMVLFAIFFFDSYIRPRPAPAVKSSESSSKSSNGKVTNGSHHAVSNGVHRRSVKAGGDSRE